MPIHKDSNTDYYNDDYIHNDDDDKDNNNNKNQCVMLGEKTDRDRELVSSLTLWAQSATKAYIRTNNKLQSVS